MDLIDRQALLKQIDIDSDGEPGYYGDTWKFIDTIKSLPSVQLSTNLAEVGTNLAEEYARAVRNWLVNYQVKCADLAGRYTPYEVLGWIVSDWRKENGIW